jgi:murein L,D-transpeptidase YafK
MLCGVVGAPLRLAAANATLPASARADKVIVLKKDRKLLLMRGSDVLKTYRIALGSHPAGPKMYSGDHRTPEGNYVIDRRNPQSQYYRSLHISYPSAADVERARKSGKDPGRDIFIHGLPNGQGWIGKAHTLMDWTLGCIAVTDEEIEEIWRVVPDGTPIEIRP